jgi:hypothetical protein
MRAALFSYVKERDVLRCRVGGRPVPPPPTVMGMGSLLGSWCGSAGARATGA